MVDESGSVSAALMHLFYYQQGLFVDEAQPGSLLREVAAGVTAANPAASVQPTPWHPPAQVPSCSLPDSPTDSPAAPRPAEHLAEEPAPGPNGADLADAVEASDVSAQVRVLYERRAELQWCLESGSLRAQNEALESQVLKMQEDFIALQEEFRTMKERCGEQLESLSKALEAQQGETWAAEKRVVCTEDLVRFHEEQRRLMAGHWKSMCQMKDERIRYLNLQLTEYTADYPGTPKQTEASLSHELQCLQDRHAELRAHCGRRGARLEHLGARLAEARAEERGLREAESEAREAACSSQASRLPSQSAVACAGLRGRAGLLCQWRRARELEAPAEAQGGPPWPHACIWRDELDVRERQLEKITAQLDRTNNALHAAQAALAVQRARHEEMKSKHREAEAGFRESERQKERWQGNCLEFRRAEAELRRALEARVPSASSTAAPAPPRPAPGCMLGGAVVAARTGGLLGHGLRGGVHPAGFPPQSRALPDANWTSGRPEAGPQLQERIAAIGRETRRLVALRRQREAEESEEARGEATEADPPSKPSADTHDADADNASEIAARASQA